MRIEILDVAHGFCALLVSDAGTTILFDCGHREDLRPSAYLREKGIRWVNRFVVTNYDEDHISDLPNLQDKFGILVLQRNDTISPAELRKLKRQSGPISLAMNRLLHMIERSRRIPDVNSDPSGLTWTCFHTRYPNDFVDTNNLSLVTFIHYRDLHLVLPGDLEKSGWDCLLENPHFREELTRVNIFVTSHHGRKSGYHAEVFEYCSPDIIVISDGPKEFATQEMVTTYGRHANGIDFKGKTRRVLTTRHDGIIALSQTRASRPLVETEFG